MIRLKNDIHYLPHLIENIDITDGVMTGKQNKLRIAVLFGGRSPEHDVSVLSATNVMQALDADKYEAVPVFVTREGQWLLSSYEQGQLAKPSSGTEICLVSGGYGRIIGIDAQKGLQELPKIDALFPVLHGLHGEDGAVQGLAEVACVPLIGCGILGSAVALDKDMTKRVNREAAVPVAHAVTLHSGNVPEFSEVENALGLPFFVKPARQGSSVGVSKVSGTTINFSQKSLSVAARLNVLCLRMPMVRFSFPVAARLHRLKAIASTAMMQNIRMRTVQL